MVWDGDKFPQYLLASAVDIRHLVCGGFYDAFGWGRGEERGTEGGCCGRQSSRLGSGDLLLLSLVV